MIINGKQGRLKMSNGLKVPYREENIGRCMCPECPVLAGIRVGKQEPGGILLQERKGKVTIAGFLVLKELSITDPLPLVPR